MLSDYSLNNRARLWISVLQETPTKLYRETLYRRITSGYIHLLLFQLWLESCEACVVCLDKKNSLVQFEMRHNLVKRALRFLPRWPGVIISTSIIKSPIFIPLDDDLTTVFRNS